MKRGVYLLILLSFILIISLNVVSADSEVYCIDSDGQVYGKENILSQEFVTKEDFCVLVEKIHISELDMRSINPEGKSSEEFGEGAVWWADMFSETRETYILRCLNNDCNSAKVNECKGENCGLINY